MQRENIHKIGLKCVINCGFLLIGEALRLTATFCKQRVTAGVEDYRLSSETVSVKTEMATDVRARRHSKLLDALMLHRPKFHKSKRAFAAFAYSLSTSSLLKEDKTNGHPCCSKEPSSDTSEADFSQVYLFIFCKMCLFFCFVFNHRKQGTNL